MLLVDAIAEHRGKWAQEVLELPPEALAYEIGCLMARDERVANLVDRMSRAAAGGILPGLFPVLDLRSV